MKLNTLIEHAKTERHTNCCIDQVCVVCGSHVSSYNANAPLTKRRPKADRWDYWAACDNADCEHSYGEGFFRRSPEWVIK